MSNLKAFLKNNNKKDVTSLSKLLERIIPKDSEKDKPFHYWIDSSKHKLYKKFCQHPNFSQIVRFHYNNDKKSNKGRKSKKSNITFMKRKSHRSMVVSTTSNIDSSGNEINANVHKSNLQKVKEENERTTEENDKNMEIPKSKSKITPIEGNKNKQLLPLSSSRSPNEKWINKLDSKNPIKLLFEKKLKSKSFTGPNSTPNKQGIPNINQNHNNSNSISTQDTKRNIRFFEMLKKEIKSKSQLRPLSKNATFRLEKFSSLLHKCEDNINRGNSLDSKMEKNNEKLDKILKVIEKDKNQLNKNKELALFQQLQRKKTKYDIMHEKSFQKIKDSAKFKVSESFAYYNRKNYREVIQHRNRDEPYELYAQDLNKIIEKVFQKKTNEKKEIEYIDNILDNTIKDKEFLKNKIDFQQMKYAEIKEKEINGGSCSINNNYFSDDESKTRNKKNNENVNKFGFKNKSFDKITLQILEDLEKKHKLKI